MSVYKNIQHIHLEGSAWWGEIFVGGANVNWTVPNGVTSVKVYAVGGGGVAWKTYAVTTGFTFNLNIASGSGTGGPGTGNGGLGPANPGFDTVVTPPAVLGQPQLRGNGGNSGGGGSNGGAGGNFSGGDGGVDGSTGGGGGGGSPRQGGYGGGIGNGGSRNANWGPLSGLQTWIDNRMLGSGNYGDGGAPHGATAGSATGNPGQPGGGGEGVRASLTFDTRGGSGGPGFVFILMMTD